MEKEDDTRTYLLIDLPRQTILDIQRLATDEQMTVEEWMNRAVMEGLDLFEKELKAKKKAPKKAKK